MSVLPVVTNLVYGMEVIDIASNVNSSQQPMANIRPMVVSGIGLSTSPEANG